jgi:hypothetical protein
MRFLTLLAVVWSLIGGAAMATEEPPFTVAVRQGEFELRDYPALVAANVTVGGDRDAAANAGFRVLAHYIFGGNHRRQSIAMTAPVVQAQGQAIAMTAPVTQAPSGSGWTVQFIMPRGSTLETLPEPNDKRVRLSVLPARRVAVKRFSGFVGSGDVARETAALRAFMSANHVIAAGQPSVARYDPPWTPWFMRRNEIWIAVAGSGQS